MIYLVIGNSLAFVASLIMVYISALKDKERIILFQIVQVTLQALSTIVIGGFTGAIVHLISMIRNILCYNNKINKKIKLLLIILSLVVSITFKKLGAIGFIPLFGTVLHTWFIDEKNVKKYKFFFAFACLTWFVYDVLVGLYVQALFDFLSVSINIFTAFKVNKKEEKNEKG